MKILHTALNVLDLERSLDFYVNKAGFREQFRVVSPGGDITKVFLELGESEHQIELIHDRNRKELYEVGDGLAHIGLKVEDMAKTYQEWTSLGITFSHEPFHMDGAPESMKFAFLVDPDGYPIELIEEK